MPQSKFQPAAHTKGILHPKAGELNYTLSRYVPSKLLQPYVLHYWTVQWDLRGRPPYNQFVLTHPNVNLIFERNRSGIFGVSSTSYERRLEGTGKAYGVKFQSAGFYPFWQKTLSELTDQHIDVEEGFPCNIHSLERKIFGCESEEDALEQIDAFLLQFLPDPDPNCMQVNQWVTEIKNNRSIKKVNDAVKLFHVHPRTLQRLFRRYVGVSPKWVIGRYRLHDAAEWLAQSESLDLTELSLQLGYYDQSHFIHDFKRFIGCSPGEYYAKTRVSSLE